MDVKYDVILGELREGDSGGGGGGSYIPTSEKGAANGVATLDANGKVPQVQLDVPAPLILNAAPTTATIGVPGQLAVNTATSKTYHCTAVTESGGTTTYTWTDDINANGGTFTGSITLAYGRSLVLYQSTNAGNGCIVFRAGQCNNWWSMAGYSCKAMGGYALAFGNAVEAHEGGAAFGKYSTTYNAVELALKVGIGTATSNRKDGLQLDWSGNLYISGGHQQHITTIPAATTSYNLAEGMQSHIPDSAPTYTLPTISDATRTHEIFLTVRFSDDVTSLEFEDVSGNTLEPLPGPTPAAGMVICYRCTWEPLLGRWVIMPVKLGTYEEAEP